MAEVPPALPERRCMVERITSVSKMTVRVAAKTIDIRTSAEILHRIPESPGECWAMAGGGRFYNAGRPCRGQRVALTLVWGAVRTLAARCSSGFMTEIVVKQMRPGVAAQWSPRSGSAAESGPVFASFTLVPGRRVLVGKYNPPGRCPAEVIQPFLGLTVIIVPPRRL